MPGGAEAIVRDVKTKKKILLFLIFSVTLLLRLSKSVHVCQKVKASQSCGLLFETTCSKKRDQRIRNLGTCRLVDAEKTD